MTLSQLDEKRRQIKNKIIIGIDPANEKHQGYIIDEYGISIGKTFSFGNNHKGITTKLWYQLKKRLEPDQINPDTLIFAIEASLDFWQILAAYLENKGYKVALVSPLTTKKTRALPGNDFSRTDPKDARLVAENTKEGFFHWYRHDTPREKAMKTLSLTYNKIRKDLQSNQARLRSQVKRIFPEFMQIVTLNTETAIHLLSKYLFPEEFINMDIETTTSEIRKISWQYDQSKLLELQASATNSIGIPKSIEEKIADKITVTTLITLIKTLKQQQKTIKKELVKMAKESPYFKIITSLDGISDLTASLFLAEVVNPDKYDHFKQMQKLAGLNLRLNTSGNSRSYYKINKIGNSRLRWVVFQMTTETSKYIPEVRIKYLKRQLKQSGYTKNITACSAKLLQLLFCLMKNKQPYEYRAETQVLLVDLEEQYYRKTKKYKTKKPTEANYA